MRDPVFTTQFRRDLKKVQQRNYDMQKYKAVVLLLLEAQPLPANYRDHGLKGVWKQHRELHIEPDWLLVYKIDGNDCIFSRTGTHADLFSM